MGASESMLAACALLYDDDPDMASARELLEWFVDGGATAYVGSAFESLGRRFLPDQ